MKLQFKTEDENLRASFSKSYDNASEDLKKFSKKNNRARIQQTLCFIAGILDVGYEMGIIESPATHEEE